eukprot:m.340402 g.340402  ORF g.340402 m.340402 type:complete len:1079 (+) comp20594_c1_seq6:527-3763(+)
METRWRRTRDPYGNIYFYSADTLRSQWEVPQSFQDQPDFIPFREYVPPPPHIGVSGNPYGIGDVTITQARSVVLPETSTPVTPAAVPSAAREPLVGTPDTAVSTVHGDDGSKQAVQHHEDKTTVVVISPEMKRNVACETTVGDLRSASSSSWESTDSSDSLQSTADNDTRSTCTLNTLRSTPDFVAHTSRPQAVDAEGNSPEFAAVHGELVPVPKSSHMHDETTEVAVLAGGQENASMSSRLPIVNVASTDDTAKTVPNSNNKTSAIAALIDGMTMESSEAKTKPLAPVTHDEYNKAEHLNKGTSTLSATAVSTTPATPATVTADRTRLEAATHEGGAHLNTSISPQSTSTHQPDATAVKDTTAASVPPKDAVPSDMATSPPTSNTLYERHSPSSSRTAVVTPTGTSVAHTPLNGTPPNPTPLAVAPVHVAGALTSVQPLSNASTVNPGTAHSVNRQASVQTAIPSNRGVRRKPKKRPTDTGDVVLRYPVSEVKVNQQSQTAQPPYTQALQQKEMHLLSKLCAADVHLLQHPEQAWGIQPLLKHLRQHDSEVTGTRGRGGENTLRTTLSRTSQAPTTPTANAALSATSTSDLSHAVERAVLPPSEPHTELDVLRGNGYSHARAKQQHEILLQLRAQHTRDQRTATAASARSASARATLGTQSVGSAHRGTAGTRNRRSNAPQTPGTMIRNDVGSTNESPMVEYLVRWAAEQGIRAPTQAQCGSASHLVRATTAFKVSISLKFVSGFVFQLVLGRLKYWHQCVWPRIQHMPTGSAPDMLFNFFLDDESPALLNILPFSKSILTFHDIVYAVLALRLPAVSPIYIYATAFNILGQICLKDCSSNSHYNHIQQRLKQIPAQGIRNRNGRFMLQVFASAAESKQFVRGADFRTPSEAITRVHTLWSSWRQDPKICICPTPIILPKLLFGLHQSPHQFVELAKLSMFLVLLPLNFGHIVRSTLGQPSQSLHRAPTPTKSNRSATRSTATTAGAVVASTASATAATGGGTSTNKNPKIADVSDADAVPATEATRSTRPQDESSDVAFGPEPQHRSKRLRLTPPGLPVIKYGVDYVWMFQPLVKP